MKRLLGCLLACSLLTTPSLAFAQEAGGIATVATIGEPPTLDPMVSTADLVGTITQHVFETLYTFDKSWKVTPLLADDPEKVPEEALQEDEKLLTLYDLALTRTEDGI